MKLKKLLVISIALIALTGCSSQKEMQISDLDQQLIALEADNKQLQEQVEALEVQLDKLTEENTVLKSELEGVVQTTQNEYTIYTRDVDSWEIIEADKVQVSKTDSLVDQLKTIADGLSKSVFNGYPIDVIEIKQVNNEQIAYIDLKDKDAGSDETWDIKYFQGSAGSQITSTALEETLLQRGIEGPWIDGISITYNGEAFVDDHISFGYIIHR